MYGPIEAKHHDYAILRISELLPKLEQRMTMPEGTVFSLDGEPAYPLRVHLITPFKGAFLNNQEKIFNSRMSKLRSSVEWTFGKILSLFAFVDYKKKSETILTACGSVLLGGNFTNQVPHLFVWKCDQ